MNTDNQEIAKVYYTCLVDQEHVIETYSKAISILELKKRLLDIPLGYSLRDELDLHKAVMSFSTASISHIITLQKQAELKKLNFPIYHDLLRKFRDFNHHEHYLSFGPAQVSVAGESLGVDFYVYNTLKSIPAIKNAYQSWCQSPRNLTLDTLLRKNYEYVLELSQSQLQSKFGHLSFKVNVDQRHGFWHLAKSDLDNWNNTFST